MSESTIKAIDSTSVHRITSGQVVIDLQTAVKELVENSLDAGATSIEVRFKDFGIKSIEVVDNGHGIAPEDYDRLAIKHHTSKLASFEDLGTVLTFGFRGEALSSLHALSSSFSVTTATAAQAPMGTVLEFDKSGKVKDKSGKVARQRGTSVMVTGLFAPLPVRRKEFEKNAKREYGKALNLLQAYALVPCANENRGVRLVVSNHPTKGARSIQIRTDGSPSSRASVSSLWGPKSLDNVVALDLNLEIEPERSSVLKKRGVAQAGSTAVKVRGLVSKFAPGCGRTSTDRQFFYVNGRPCSPTKIQKAFNEVYRSFNANQVPFVIADFQLPTNAYDINVSPDKRTIFIHSETNLLQALKTSLEENFSSSRSTFTVNKALTTGKNTVNLLPGSDQGGSPTNGNGGSHRDEDAEDTSPMDSGDIRANEDNYLSTDKHDKDSQNRRPIQHEETDVEKTYGKTSDFNVTRSSPQPSDTDARRNSMEIARVGTIEPRSGLQDAEADKDDDLAADVLPPDASLSIEVDEETSSQPESHPEACSSIGLTSKPCRPLSSPSSTSASQPLLSRTPSTSELGGRPPSPSEHSLDFNGSDERPWKRQRTGPAPPPSTTKTGPAQTVLDTAGAAWSLKIQTAREMEHRKTAESTANRARSKLRSQLSGFSAPGSQMEPIEVDEEEADDSQRDESEEQTEMQSEVDELMDEEASEDVIAHNNTSRAGHRIIEPDSFADETGDVSGQAPYDSRESGNEYVSLEEIIRTTTRDVTLRLDLKRVLSTWSRLRSTGCPELYPPCPSKRCQPSANISYAGDAEDAERELARVIHKEDFSTMHILGQFNLGFIITRHISSENGKCVADDLFIVDQHAADEKYNFEILQQTTKINSQKLFHPRPLELTAANKLVAMDNMETLRANGFEVMVDGDTGHRECVKLVAHPVSKGTTFDIKDLEELLHLMQDQPNGKMVRCSKARAMFAMRACRMSVMVGKALTTGQMTTVVRHMGTIDQPWNCPHGRPTMRHLVSLNQMDHSDDRMVDWTKFSRMAWPQNL